MEERGDAELMLRSAYRATPPNRWDELMQELVHRMGFAGTVSDVSVIQPDDFTRPFVLSFAYRRAEYPDWKNEKISFPTPFFTLPDLTDEQRISKMALPLGSPQEVTFETTVKLPKDFLPIIPENVSHKTDFAEFSAIYDLDKETVLHGTLRLKILRREVPGQKREEYVGLTKRVDEVLRRYIPIHLKFAIEGMEQMKLMMLL